MFRFFAIIITAILTVACAFVVLPKETSENVVQPTIPAVAVQAPALGNSAYSAMASCETLEVFREPERYVTVTMQNGLLVEAHVLQSDGSWKIQYLEAEYAKQWVNPADATIYNVYVVHWDIALGVERNIEVLALQNLLCGDETS